MTQAALRDHVNSYPLNWTENKVVSWQQKDKELREWVMRLRTLVGLNNRKPRVRIKKWDRWFQNLKAGDKVTVQFPWSDGNVPGGYKTTATVDMIPNSKGREFFFRYEAGHKGSEVVYNWQGHCYFHIMPLGYSLEYCPKRGYLMCKIKEKVKS